MLLSAHLTSNDFNGRQLLFMTPYIEHDVIRHLINNPKKFNVEIDDLAIKPYIPHKSLLQ